MIAPPNFGYVEDGIYRCGSPDGRSFGFLASLKLKTSILLTENHDEAFVRFLQESGVRILCPLSLTSSSSSIQCQAPPLRAYAQRPPPPPQTGRAPLPGSAAPSEGGGGEASAADATGLRVGDWYGASSAHDRHSTGDGAQRSGDGFADEEHLGHELATAVRNESITSATPPSSPGLAEDRNSNVARFLRRNNNNSNNNGAGGSASATVSGFGGGEMASNGSGAMDVQKSMSATGRFGGPYSAGHGGAAGVSAGSSGAFNFTTIGSGYNGGGAGSGGGGQRGLMTLSESVVVDILHVLLDPQYYPVLITCAMGRYRTGIVCGCLRKLQRWNLVSTLEEYRRFAGEKSRAENEDFIELFDKDLVNLELEGGRRPTILYY